MSNGDRRIGAVLFDLGGTLVDESDFEAWSEIARHVPLDLDPEELRHAYGEVEREVDLDPLKLEREAARLELWRRVLSRASGRELEAAAAARFLAAAPPPSERPVALYSDVRRCLDGLVAERRRLGVVSNSQSEASVRRILDRVGILGYFDHVVSSGTEGVAKPDPEIFRRAVARLRLAPETVLYVGNLEHTDALAARRAGLASVWLHREGTGLSDGTPEITSLLEVPVVLHELEDAPRVASALSQS